jgi:hypothetical protein
MDLDINPPESDVLRRVSSDAHAVCRLVTSVLEAEAVPSSTYHLDVAGDDPFAIDFAVFKCRSLTYEVGVSLAVKFQNALRLGQFFGWRIRVLVQPESEELVLDYVAWLIVDVVRISELRGGRQIEMFKDFETFKKTCWA